LQVGRAGVAGLGGLDLPGVAVAGAELHLSAPATTG
jgi:hypothetical protein